MFDGEWRLYDDESNMMYLESTEQPWCEVVVILTGNHIFQSQTYTKTKALSLKTWLFYIIGGGSFFPSMFAYGSFHYLIGRSISTLHIETDFTTIEHLSTKNAMPTVPLSQHICRLQNNDTFILTMISLVSLFYSISPLLLCLFLFIYLFISFYSIISHLFILFRIEIMEQNTKIENILLNNYPGLRRFQCRIYNSWF